MFSKCLLPVSLFLSFTYSTDVPRGPGCEICASCFYSQKCKPPFQTITVTPKDSKVTSNCSIETDGKVQDMTWHDLEKHLNASDAGLFLQQIDSKNRSHQLRECFSIKYASEYVLLLPCLYQIDGEKNIIMRPSVFLCVLFFKWIITHPMNAS